MMTNQMQRAAAGWRVSAPLALALAAAMSASAADNLLFDFNEDPTGILNLYGNAEWRPDNGKNNTGYLSITDAIDSQGGIIVFDDFDNGLIVKGFNFKVDLRVGNSSDSDGRPADGFSVNFARENDPIVVKSINGETPDGYADSAGAHEFGTRTGIAVSFDTWSGNTLPDGPDLEGLIVRVDNVTVRRVAMPIRNGACEDPQSLQTGPWNAELAGDPSELCWQELEVDLDAAGLLTVKWKGATVLEDFATGFAPSRGRIVFMGRTGGNNQNNHVDNVRITTIPATSATVSGLTHTPTGFTVNIEDAPGSVVTTGSVVVKLDGATVAATVTKNGGVTSATYNTAANPFPSASAHSVEVSFADATRTFTETRTFTTETYATVTAGMKATGVNTSQTGFRIRPHQVQYTTPELANTLVRTEDQLAGRIGANAIDLPSIGADAQGFVNWENPINIGNSGGAGEFPDTLGFDNFGMPAFDADGNQLANENNSAMEILTFIEFPTAGFYRLGVRSDDAFRLSIDLNPRDQFAARLGQFDAGRGMDPGTEFYVRVVESGIYPARLIWSNGGGGAGVELYEIKANGDRVMVGDVNTTGYLRAFRTSSAPVQPYVSSVYPAIGATEVHPQPELTVVLSDITNLTQDSVNLAVNGTPLTVTRTAAGGQLTVVGKPASLLASGSLNTATLTYTASAGPVTRTWTFTTVNTDGVLTLPTAIASAPGSGRDPGFKVKIVQLDIASDFTDPAIRTANELRWAEGVIAGFAGPNSADLTGFGADGYYVETSTINYNQPNDAGTGLDSNGNFQPDRQLPGIPGLGDPAAARDNIAGEFLTFIEFPSAGYYRLGVNSDDGFKTTYTHDRPVPSVQILAPAGIAGGVAAVPSVRGDNQGGGIFGPLPLPAIEAEVVLAVGNSDAAPTEEGCGTALQNAAAVAGKIVLVSRGTCTFLEKARNAANAGAIGVLVYQNRTDFPIVLGGDVNTITIPVLMISQADGLKLRGATGARVRISGDDQVWLGSANVGRGSSDTLYGFIVPQAGVYPFRTLWFEGGGGANVEWFSVNPDGSRTLLNDTSARALKTFRSRIASVVPTLSMATSGGNLVLTFTGTLQSADAVTGPFTDTVLTSPATIPPEGAGKFYRSRN